MLGQERISRGGWTDGRRLRLRAANEDESGHARARIPLKKNLYAGVRWRVLQRLRQGRGRVDCRIPPHACVRTSFYQGSRSRPAALGMEASVGQIRTVETTLIVNAVVIIKVVSTVTTIAVLVSTHGSAEAASN